MKGALDGLRKASGGAAAQVVAGAAAAGALQAAAAARRRRDAERIVYFPSCAARNMGAQRGHDGVDPLPGDGRAAVRQGGLRRRLSGAPGRAVLRPAVREQGADGGRRPQVGRARSGAARGERRRAPADRVRHEPLRLPHEALPGRAAAGAGQHRVRARHACCRAWRWSRARPARRRASRCAACARWASSTSCAPSRARCSAEVVAVDAVLCCGFAGDRASSARS